MGTQTQAILAILALNKGKVDHVLFKLREKHIFVHAAQQSLIIRILVLTSSVTKGNGGQDAVGYGAISLLPDLVLPFVAPDPQFHISHRCQRLLTCVVAGLFLVHFHSVGFV